ncbi:MAG: phosphate signaling complex protein PhoU [Salegentibacter sp.]|uniref:Phosphate-specific transport system accessory protein PhoU n=1 Tax=Salegentibacter flavus TaxID=287099 RepID=A0A1I5CAG4_9FLAO|nr:MULTISPECIES: phosphate signaling complex protein PhoU [Salegentibacter]MDR9457319.1 phosphate signaling complex protein PhoU [Salegentibacter sp.]SFN83621.1 phosphate uptake regulator, PhoU [Salegentibacter flavus]
MISLDQHKEALNQAGLEMLQLCNKQLENTREAFFTHDSELAEEVIHTENRVNALDLRIDRDCERFIALHNPVASDLRFALALRKINFDLERVGDHAYGISKYIVELDTPIDKKVLEMMRVEEMFDAALSMLEDITDSYEEVDTKMARKVFKKDKTLNQINMDSFGIISEEVQKDPKLINQFLLLFSVIKKLERIGDLITNIAEEIIFYSEAEVMKHRKKKKVRRSKD